MDFFADHPGTSDKDHVLAVIAQNKLDVMNFQQDNDFLKKRFLQSSKNIDQSNFLTNYIKDQSASQKKIAATQQFDVDQANYRTGLVKVGQLLVLQSEPRFLDIKPETAVNHFDEVAAVHNAIQNDLKNVKTQISAIDQNVDASEPVRPGCGIMILGSVISAIGGYATDAFLPCLAVGLIASASIGSYIIKRKIPKHEEFLEERKIFQDEEKLISKRPDAYNDTINALKAMQKNQPDMLKNAQIQAQAEYIVTSLLNKQSGNQPAPM